MLFVPSNPIYYLLRPETKTQQNVGRRERGEVLGGKERREDQRGKEGSRSDGSREARRENQGEKEGSR